MIQTPDVPDWRQVPKKRGFGIHTGAETPTQQHHAKSADLNEIVRRFGITGGQIPVPQADPAYYGDFTDATDFRTALDRVRAAQEHFESLPAAIRERFANDPVRLHSFVMDPKNKDESVKLGLLQKRKPVVPADVKRAEQVATWAKANPEKAEELGLSKKATAPAVKKSDV